MADDLLTPRLLLADLIRDALDAGWREGSVTTIMRELLESDVTDAERAGERLLVFGWERERRTGSLVWDYRIVGEETGWEHVRFSLAVHGDGADGPLAVLGLQLQIALNGLDSTSPDELDCYLELARESVSSG